MVSPASKESHSGEPKPYAALRAEMVERNIAARGVRDELVLDAMRKVPRELFLPKNLREFAYEDSPLPIAGEQTISQPYIVARMLDAAAKYIRSVILECWCGSRGRRPLPRPWLRSTRNRTAGRRAAARSVPPPRAARHNRRC